MVILDLEVLGIISKKIVGNIQHQKDVQRNSVQKEVLNSSPSFFSASLVKKNVDNNYQSGTCLRTLQLAQVGQEGCGGDSVCLPLYPNRF